MDIKKFYILFPNVTSGLSLESVLKREKIKYTIVPTPRALSSSCGISIMYDEKDEEKIRMLIQENSIKITGFKSLVSENKNFYFDK